MQHGKFILVTGGARSGKSAFAEKLAKESGKKVIYLATATAEDEEMAQRIARHRRRRPPGWETVEEPLDVPGVIEKYSASGQLILVDCLALFLSNLLLKAKGQLDPEAAPDFPGGKERVLQAIKRLGEVISFAAAEIIIVTNEVGWGLVPAHPLGRVYRDLLGIANQRLASLADQVYLVVCGLALEIKSLQTDSLAGGF